MLKLFKRIAAGCAAVFTAVSLCGCNVKLPFVGNSLNFDKSYTVSAEINCDRLNAKANITRAGANDWEFVFTEPKELNGVIIAFGANGYSARLGTLNFIAAENSTYTVLPKVIGGALDVLAGMPSDSFTQNNGVVSADVDLNGKTITVNADEKGNLISLKSPYHQLSVNFSGQQPYKSPLPDEGGLING